MLDQDIYGYCILVNKVWISRRKNIRQNLNCTQSFSFQQIFKINLKLEVHIFRKIMPVFLDFVKFGEI